MNVFHRRVEPYWRITLDLLSAKILVWVASAGRDVDLTPEAHIYFFDRYYRLAAYHRSHGRVERAKRIQAKAEQHYRSTGGDGPYAAAMAMPRPRQFIRTNVVSRSRFSDPDDAA
jgi:hypothetical protein